MSNFVETRTFKFSIVAIVAVFNIAFYTWGYPESGAQYAWDVHPLFAIAMQLLFSIPIVAYIYFGIKNI